MRYSAGITWRVLVGFAAVAAAGVFALILITSRHDDRTGDGAGARGQRAGQPARAPDNRPPPALAASASSAEQGRPGARRTRPELSPGPTSSPRFEDEARDGAWADSMERDVRQRVDALLAEVRGDDRRAVNVEGVECRRQRCRLRVGGSDSTRFQAFVEALQESRGFYGHAAQLFLTDYVPADGPEGRSEIVVVLSYERGGE
jgi:hypothetical protein